VLQANINDGKTVLPSIAFRISKKKEKEKKGLYYHEVEEAKITLPFINFSLT
jgi:hypothetical protein